MKTCPQCKQTKPFSDYGKNRARKDGLQGYCKECNNKKNKEYRGRSEVKEYYNEQRKERYKNNPQKRLNDKMTKETRWALLGVHSDYSIVSEQYGMNKVGLTSPQYRAYMESLWEEGMSWDNYGHGEGKWCIDHIIPKNSFDLTDPEQYKKCSHYTNTQPMWFVNNSSKKDKLLTS
tara:strand:- start:137 stop:664 length:528 start_codon:yes stop_codon:yes gene_type:complete